MELAAEVARLSTSNNRCGFFILQIMRGAFPDQAEAARQYVLEHPSDFWPGQVREARKMG